MAGKLISLAVIAAMAATNAQAAYLSDIQGAVLINNEPASGNAEVVPGDRVKALTGSVKVVYSNGATVPVAAGQTLVVLANAPAPSDPPVDPGDTGGSLGTTTIVAGGLAIAGAAGLAIALSGSNNKPASP